MLIFFLICTQIRQVYSINGPKFRLEVKQLLFPLFRPNTILLKNLETLVCVFPSPMLIWALQRSQCFKIRVAQHWGGRGHITVRAYLWGVNLKNFPENSREAVSVSRIFDEDSTFINCATGLHEIIFKYNNYSGLPYFEMQLLKAIE